MGLFIGASLLTILEILDYLCEVGGPGPQLGEGEESRHSIAGWGWVGGSGKGMHPAHCPIPPAGPPRTGSPTADSSHPLAMVMT